MTDQIHLLITTAAADDPQTLVDGCKGLADARLAPLTVISTTEAQNQATTDEGFAVVAHPQISNKDEFAQLLFAVETLKAEAPQPADIYLVVPAAALEKLNYEDLRACRTIFWHDWVDVAAFGRPIFEEAAKNNPMNIKIAASQNHRVLYVSRAGVPYGADVMVVDTNIRAYRASALRHLAETEPSPLERTEKIALLRGIEAGLGVYLSLITPTA